MTDQHILPPGWTTAAVGDLLVHIETGKSPRCDTRPAEDGERGVIKVSAMTYGQFDPAENKALLPGAPFDPDHEIRGGDLLLSRANTAAYVGAVVLVPDNVRPGLLLSDKSLRLVPAPGVEPKWLMYALRSEVARAQIEEMATGTKDSMRNISQDKLRAIRLPVPPAAEQQRIVAILDQQLSLVEATDVAVAALHRKNALLRRSLVAAGIGGVLAGQDPSDESAELLLKRIAEELAAFAPAARRSRARTVPAARASAGTTVVEESA